MLQVGRSLVEEELIEEIKDVNKLKEIKQRLKQRLAAKSLSLFIRSLNVSLVTRRHPNKLGYGFEQQQNITKSLTPTGRRQ